MKRFLRISCAILACIPTIALADMYIGGDGSAEALFPSIKKPEQAVSPEIHRMALQLDTAPCDKLRALDDSVKRSILVVNLLLQTPNALSKIVGPECGFLGPVQEVAAIEDTLLTSSDQTEILYLIEKYDIFNI